MEHIEFMEDKTFSHKNNQENKVPQKGIEGWLYKKIPGSPIIKKIILFSLIVILFIVSTGVILITKNEKAVEGKSNFQERAKSTQLR